MKKIEEKKAKHEKNGIDTISVVTVFRFVDPSLWAICLLGGLSRLLSKLMKGSGDVVYDDNAPETPKTAKYLLYVFLSKK
jgi:hypothetical protein